MSLEELHDLIYGDRPVSVATLKAEVSHITLALRGGAVDVVTTTLDAMASGSTAPSTLAPTGCRYRSDADIVSALDSLSRDDLEGAMRLYRGQLLPFSESPFIIDLRHHLDAVLRTARLRHGEVDQLLKFADIHPFDVEILDYGRTTAAPSHPLHRDLTARLVKMHD